MKKMGFLVLLFIMIIGSIGLLTFYPFNKSQDLKLYNSILNQNYEQMKEAIEEGANINRLRNRSLLTETNPIRIAMKSHKYNNQVAYWLLDFGAKVNERNVLGNTLLMNSMSTVNYGLANALLEKGAKVNAKSYLGYTALDVFFTIRNEFTNEKKLNSLLFLLIDNGAKVGPKTLEKVLKRKEEYSYTGLKTVQIVLQKLIENGYKSKLDPLVEAAILGDSIKVIDLIQKNNLNESNVEDVLQYVAAFGTVDAVKMLEENGVIINKEYRYLKHPFEIAIFYGNFDVFEYLYKKYELEINQQLFEFALNNYDYKMIRFMFDQGITYQYREEYGFNQYNNVALNGDIELLKLLTENIEISEQIKNNALAYAIKKNFIISDYLLENGADINYNDGNIFSIAGSLGDLKTLDYLKQKENIITVKDYKEKIIYAAIGVGNRTIVEHLLKDNANVNYIMDNQLNLLMQAVRWGWYDIVKLLIDNGADLEYKNEYDNNNTILCFAAKYGSKNILKYLIQSGVDINYQNDEGQTPIMIAIESGYIDNVDLLLQNNADINLLDKNGKSAIDIAKELGEKEMVKIIQRNLNRN